MDSEMQGKNYRYITYIIISKELEIWNTVEQKKVAVLERWPLWGGSGVI